MNIIFFGTPLFSAKILSFLIENGISVVAVVTKPDRPQGRSRKVLPSAVKALVREKYPYIPIYDPPKVSTEEIANKLRSYHPDLFVVASFGEIIKQNLLNIPKLAINVHTSLLPKYRGASPIRRAIIEGEKETGVTIMEMVLELDAGDIIDYEKTPIPEEMNFGELEEILCRISCKLLLKVLGDIEKGSIKKISQDASKATYAKKLLPEEYKIFWEKPAKKIHDLIRALSPAPGAWTFIQIGDQKKRLKILKAHPIQGKETTPGEICHIIDSKEVTVSCGEGKLKLFEVQLEGKKIISAEEFIRGYPYVKFLF